ncbi:MAG: hypothetical protein IJ716_09705 [Lachnospiraceae bacterium]|nr:hypothetical protein [Lachnospiraceae bacterium]
MNEFENKLIIKEEAYENSFFPKIPNIGKRGSAFILTGGCNDDILVTDHTTTKEIRKGKYTQLVEISTKTYLKEIRFNSPSQETFYSFDVYVKATICVKDPIVFYENRNIDVDAYFDNLFSLDVRKITQRYSILDYVGMDEELTQKLSAYNTFEESTGFSYQISVVSAKPGKEAEQYVKQQDQQKLDAMLKKHARGLANSSYTGDYIDAIMTEIAEGKISEVEAAKKIREYNEMNYKEHVEHLDELRNKGFITDREARVLINPILSEVGVAKQIQQVDENIHDSTTEDTGMEEFYS